MDVIQSSSKKAATEPRNKNYNIHIYLDPAIIAIFLCVCYSRVPIAESDAILAYSWITFQIFSGIFKINSFQFELFVCEMKVKESKLSKKTNCSNCIGIFLCRNYIDIGRIIFSTKNISSDYHIFNV